MIKNQKGIALPLIAVGILIVATVMVFVMRGDDDASEAEVATPNVPVNSQNETSNENTEESTETDENTETINLEAVGNYTGSGTATRTTEGMYKITIVADIDDPAEGKFYEGWVVGPSVVSTGKFEKVGGQYINEFMSDEDYSGHSRVVVTEETEADGLDGNPEDHVLEGSF